MLRVCSGGRPAAPSPLDDQRAFLFVTCLGCSVHLIVLVLHKVSAMALGWAARLHRGPPSRLLSALAADPFGDLPAQPLCRVVVTGLGLVTPLGVGVAAAWERLLSGATGVRRLQSEDLPEVG